MFGDSVEGDILETIAVALRNRFGAFEVVDIYTVGDENAYIFKAADRLFSVVFPVCDDVVEDFKDAFGQGIPWNFNAAGHLERTV